jgi:hypothetical protein
VVRLDFELFLQQGSSDPDGNTISFIIRHDVAEQFSFLIAQYLKYLFEELHLKKVLINYDETAAIGPCFHAGLFQLRQTFCLYH